MAINLDGNGLNTTGLINSATAQNSTSGTSIDFTGIPSGVKRITVMFNGVSTSGTSILLIQGGTSSGNNPSGGQVKSSFGGLVTTSGYNGGGAFDVIGIYRPSKV